jgi:enoyl-CoA hydratase/carnithine racemase
MWSRAQNRAMRLPRVTVDITSHVAHVRLARPEKLNALDGEMFEALVETGEALLSDGDTRAVVLSGSGSSFCAGLDASLFSSVLETGSLGSLGPTGAHPLASRTHGSSNRAQRAATVWADIPVPVIAAIHGHCFGGGLQVALGADLRFTAPTASLSVMEIRWGLVPDMGLYVLGPRLLRADVLAELIFSGRKLSGPEAVALGLATRVCEDPVEEALAYAREIATRSPDAVRAAKRLLALSREKSASEVLQRESTEQELLIGSPHQLEAIRANLERRPPRFERDQAARGDSSA